MSNPPFLPNLHELDRLHAIASEAEGEPPSLVIGECRLRIPEWGRWYGGLRCLDDRFETHEAQVLALPLDALDGVSGFVAEAAAAIGAVLRVRVRYLDFNLAELRFWAFEPPENGELSAGEPRESVFVDDGLGEAAPQLPPGWKAQRLLARPPWGQRWEATHVTDSEHRWIDVLQVPPSLAQHCATDLLRRRDLAVLELGGDIHAWQTPEGFIVARHAADRSLRTALRCGEVDGHLLLKAMFDAACAVDWLAGFGATHRNVSLDNILLMDQECEGLHAWLDETGYPDPIELAAAGWPVGFAAHAVPPERLRGEACVPASDQYALALAYLEARTGQLPESLGTGDPDRVLATMGGLLGAECSVLARALALDPAARWEDARGFVRTLATTLGVRAAWVRGTQPEGIVALPSADTGRLPLARYRRLFDERMAPTDAQIDAFVDYVCGKHSWYKHLPLTFPGMRFVVYLDPSAGMRLIQHPNGRMELASIDEDDARFHHAMLPTVTYRERFGLLRVEDAGAPSFSLHGESGTEYAESGAGVLADGRFERLPTEIVFAGSVEVTALIHPRGSEPWLWKRYFEQLGERCDLDTLNWPRESGGSEILRAIHCLYRDSRQSGAGYDRALEHLLAPERQRQRQRLRDAVVRVVERTFG